ncbi:hypothetical protein FB451DRAFT_1559257 [Mycena latifolia]|nr:hypothetical protein FB451DRAFT_1559257 [Mycena latifolia]
MSSRDAAYNFGPVQGIIVWLYEEVTSEQLLLDNVSEGCYTFISEKSVASQSEFHDEIRPMLVLPSTESASPRSLLYHHVHGDGLLSYNRVVAFRDIVEQQLLKCYFLERPDHQNRDPSTIISILTTYHFMRFSDRVAELKLWASSRDRILEEMYRRCSAWAKVYFTARTAIDTLPNPLVSTSSCAPTHCLDAGPLESSGSGTEGSSDDVLLPSSPNGTTWAMTDAVSTGVHDTSLVRHRAHRKSGSE